MASIGTGYDLSVSTYSPDGRVFQIEYAHKAVDNSATAIGICCRDGTVLALERVGAALSRLLAPERTANRRIYTVDKHIGIVTTGLHADGRSLADQARSEAQAWRRDYGEAVPGAMLAERLASFVQVYTQYAVVRPHGAVALIASGDKEAQKAALHMVDPAGLVHGFRGAAAGQGRQLAKAELEKLPFATMTAREAVWHAARILLRTRDQNNSSTSSTTEPRPNNMPTIEMSWVCAESGWQHALVPDDLLLAAEAEARSNHPGAGAGANGGNAGAGPGGAAGPSDLDGEMEIGEDDEDDENNNNNNTTPNAGQPLLQT